jgi:DNA-binding LacI/PurR family transcriptional regulator
LRTIHKLTVAELTAEHMREDIRSGRRLGELPGVLLLARAYDVSKEAMRAALHILEAEGLVSPGRAGAHRTVLGSASSPQRAKRVAIFPAVPFTEESRVMSDLLRNVERDLTAAGHTVTFTAKSQQELRFNPVRIAKLVAGTPADAWVVAPPPREVLEFFAAQPVPAIIIGSGCMDVSIAGVYTDVAPSYREVTRRLIALGHRRIVMICPRMRRLPVPGPAVRAFIEELAAHGIKAGKFNVPDYEPTVAGMHALLESLFSTTPPTALLVELPNWATRVFVFLAQRGLTVPGDVSLFFPYSSASQQLCDPPVAHVHWDDRLLVRRIVRWVRAVARGRADREAVAVPATLKPGGTIGPVRK